VTVSGVTSLILNAEQVIVFALRKLGVISIGQVPDYNEVAPCLLDLNLMLKNWETTGPHLWRNTLGSFPFTANTPSYPMTSDNPLRVVEVRYRYPDGHDLPLIRMSRIQYMRLPLKTSNGSPTQFYFDPQEAGQTLYLWPVLKNVTADQAVYTFQRRFQVCQSPNDSVDIVQEWLATAGYSLAEALLPNYGVGGERAARIENSARTLRRQAKAFDRPAFVQFMPAYRAR
jgi:hypothetical protein